jgi:uroporphyrinogen-III synthase
MSGRVLVTRSAGQAGPLEAALRQEGLEPVAVPAIAVEIDMPDATLDAVARALHTAAWVVVTSPNGARAIRTAARIPADREGPSWAAIGDATAEILELEGIPVAFRPSSSDARTLAAELPIRPGDAVVLVRGDLAGRELPKRLRVRGAAVTDIVAYRTVEGPATSGPLLRDAFASGPPAAILLASGSAARGLVALADAERVEIRSIPAVCLGPETAQEAGRLGFRVLATSPAADIRSLAATTAAALAHPVEMR